MSGAVPPDARRYVTSDHDGVLSALVMQHLAGKDEVNALAPIVVPFVSTSVWSYVLDPVWPRIPSVQLVRDDGVTIFTTTTASKSQVTAVFSEALSGTMILR